VPDLHVVARTSAFSFKGSSDDIPTIAKKLRVANVLQGSVRRSGNVLRISAQLVRADSGYQLWSQSYDRKLDDIFKIQDEIAAAVVKELKVSLFQGSMPKAGGTRNTEALTLIMQANALSANSRSRQEYEKINDYIQRSLKIDPSYAYAWALLSNVRLNQANLGWLPFAQGGEEARRAAEQSLALDPTLPAAHSAMTNVFLYHDWNWAAAEVQIQQSLALNPNGAGAFADAAKLYWVLGDVDKATMFQRKAIETDPVDSYAWLELGNMLRIAGKLGEAQEAIHRALDLNPGAAYAHLIAALLLLAKGDPASAMVEIDRESGPENREFGRAIGYHALGRKAEADAALAEYEKNYARTDAYGVAEIHAYRSEIEEAFQWLERAYRQRDFQCAYFVKTDLLFRNLWPDPRFKEFLRKMKLPD
jgi:tetratricopeptide (TPR) repeat protein